MKKRNRDKRVQNVANPVDSTEIKEPVETSTPSVVDENADDQSPVPNEEISQLIDLLDDNPMLVATEVLDEAATPDDGLGLFDFYEELMAPNRPQDDRSIHDNQRRLWVNLLVILRRDDYVECMHKLLNRFAAHDCYKSPSLYRGLTGSTGTVPVPEYGVLVLKAMETAADPEKRKQMSKYVNMESLYYGVPEWMVERFNNIFK